MHIHRHRQMLCNALNVPMSRVLAQFHSLRQITSFTGINKDTPTVRFAVVHHTIVHRSLREERLLEAGQRFGALIEMLFGQTLERRVGGRCCAQLLFETLQTARHIGNGRLVRFIPFARLLFGQQTFTHFVRIEIEQRFRTDTIFTGWIVGNLTFG